MFNFFDCASQARLTCDDVLRPTQKNFRDERQTRVTVMPQCPPPPLNSPPPCALRSDRFGTILHMHIYHHLHNILEVVLHLESTNRTDSALKILFGFGAALSTFQHCVLVKICFRWSHTCALSEEIVYILEINSPIENWRIKILSSKELIEEGFCFQLKCI